MIQVRNVTPELHAELVRRARLQGKTLTAYIQELLEREVARPPSEEVHERIKRRRERIALPPGSGARAVRQEREEMERDWDRLFSTRRP